MVRIRTHHNSDCDPPWIAIDMDLACDYLEDYDLEENEKKDIGCLMAGYCRLLDEQDLIGYGDYEAEAISDAANISESRRKASQK